MSRPPIKAFETVRKYCEKNKTCEGCPLYDERKVINDWCRFVLKKKVKRNEID